MSEEVVFIPKVFYLKDSTFQGKMLPNIFFKDYKIEASMTINIDYQKVGANEDSEIWNVMVYFNVAGKDENDGDNTIYEISVKYGGVFEIGNYEEGEIDKICRVHCANMIFPYAREEVVNRVIKSGVPQFFIKPVNFSELYKRHEERNQSNQENSESPSELEEKSSDSDEI